MAGKGVMAGEGVGVVVTRTTKNARAKHYHSCHPPITLSTLGHDSLLLTIDIKDRRDHDPSPKHST